MQLETIEDFKRVANALKDPNSKPFEYEVKEFGYCTRCGEITECRSWNWGSECVSGVDCLKCGRTFGGLGAPRELPSSQYLDAEDAPGRLQPKLRQLMSRESQQAYFIEALRSFIAKKDKENTDAKALARATRKTVSKGHELISDLLGSQTATSV